MQIFSQRRRVLCLGMGAALVAGNASASRVSVDHSFEFTAVDQGPANLCWLAGTAMLLSYRNNQPVSMADAASTLGQPYFGLFNSKSSLPADRVTDLASRLRMSTDGLRSMTPALWAQRISSGPVFLAGYDANADMGHVVILAGVSGDTNNFDGMQAIVVDPNGGLQKTPRLADVVKFYEGLARAGVPQLILP